MFFDIVIGDQEIEINRQKKNYREAVRAVIFQDNKILMVHSNRGDYKLPGGGVKKEENHIEALKREVEEETGYKTNEVKDKIGIVKEISLDEYEKDAVFQMTSHYYLCEVSSAQMLQRLDDYEAELDFHPVWISLQDAIYQNENAVKKEVKNKWIHREITVLRKLELYVANKMR